MSTSQANSSNSENNLGPKLRKRSRALFLSQIDAYNRLNHLMDLQSTALETQDIDTFLERFPLEDEIFSELTSLDKVITPLLIQLKEAGLEEGADLAGVHQKLRDAHLLARDTHSRCETLLSQTTSVLKNRIPQRKRVSRFAGGRRDQGGQFVDLSV